ncbi:hypothetical protein DUNSADRAFT_8607 [Dunaliella salina]|uniref:Encoded protein n=1 Tax=Dunaliella salina TaxID=3046 RepID=A0ABQ7H5S8_DUNSA|nr:hypothetical protein DUNSADRAFT_8607 [Dunaliella salina]|eukprot:KAF5842207.1 hypothetical protein DUNSADRAFT_8607 [Dunaliella salina]
MLVGIAACCRRGTRFVAGESPEIRCVCCNARASSLLPCPITHRHKHPTIAKHRRRQASLHQLRDRRGLSVRGGKRWR